jgi:phospholipase C
VLTVMAVPPDADLARHTTTVLACNGMQDRRAQRTELCSPVIPTTPGTPSQQIRYVVFITKENHTYDTIFDHIPGANDDPSLLRWGTDGSWACNRTTSAR